MHGQAIHRAQARGTTKERTIIVTDDDRTVRTVISRMLQADGYRVIEAERGEKCLFMSMEKHVDGFLVDLNLPGIDGVELCRRLRAMERYRFTPIICITSADEESAVDKAFEAGADDFVTKPINPAALRARLTGRIRKTEYMWEMERIRTTLSNP